MNLELTVNQFLRRAVFVVVPLLFVVALSAAQDSAGGGQAAAVSGLWQISWQGRRGNEQGTLHLQQDGSKLSGTFEGQRRSSALTGSIQDKEVSFNVQMQGRRTMTLAFKGTLEGDKMSGTFQPQGEGGGGGYGGHGGHRGGNENHSWTATRQKGQSGGQ